MPFTPITLPIRRPLLPLQTVTVITGESHDDLLARVEDGSLRLVFNIATPGQNMRTLRVMASSVQDCMEGRRRTETPATVLAEIADIFPPISAAVVPEIDSVNLCRVFCCSAHHVRHLEATHCIRLTRDGRIGRNGHANYCRRSVVEFLIKRRIT